MLIPVIEGVPAEFEICSEGPNHTITIPLAASRDGLKLVALELRLWAGHWLGQKMHEFKFAIVFFDEEDGEPAVIFDRYLANEYLETVRHLVMPCVCAAAKYLLDRIQPAVIYRATYTTRPSEKALGKHHIITDIIQSSGYDVRLEGLDPKFRHFWLMTRNGDAI